MEFRNIPPVAKSESPELLLTMSDLRKKRINLGISSTATAKFLGITHSILTKAERMDNCNVSWLKMYREYLLGCENGTIYYKTCRNAGQMARLSFKDTKKIVSLELLKTIRAIRTSIKIKLEDACKVLGKSICVLSEKERGRNFMSIDEYDALMKFYRAEKLKRTFGKNFREGMFKCQKQDQ